MIQILINFHHKKKNHSASNQMCYIKMDVAQTNWPSIAGWKSTPKGAIIHATNQIFIRFNSSYLKASSMAWPLRKKEVTYVFFTVSAGIYKYQIPRPQGTQHQATWALQVHGF